MRVAVVYDAHAAASDAAPDVAGVLEAVDAVCEALGVSGHDCVRIGAATGAAWTRALGHSGADVVFNLCEGLDGDAAAEPDVARAIAESGLPCTGAAPDALALARRKDVVNTLLHPDVPVPAWTLVTDAFDAAEWQHYPAIVKPAGEDAGIGITAGAVAYAEHELRRALDDARDHAPLLVQQFVTGIELVVGFVGETALPIAVVDYSGMPQHLPRVVGYAAKWDAGSAEDVGTRVICPAPVDAAIEAQAIATARTAWQAVASRGYGRVDLRSDQDGVLHVLDVNPNADLAPSAGLARMAAAAGWSYVQLVERVLDDALRTVHA